jgi:CRP-like cAMP-binding protein
MEIAKLIDFLSQSDTLSAPFSDFLRKNVVLRSYKRGALVVKAGDVVDQTWFITKGMVKSRYHDESGRQVVTRFWKENDFVILKDRDVQFGPIYAREDIVLLENARLASLSHRHLRYAFEHFPESHQLARRIYFSEIRSHEIRQHLLVLDAAQAYQAFCRHFPSTRIQIQDIAFYLNLRPYTLSRIRKQK